MGTRFNEAPASLPGKDTPEATIRPSRPCFNEAPASLPGKGADWINYPSTIKELQ